MDMANGGRTAIQIVETNSFRHIVHLSLIVVPGNDNAVKRYLANLVAKLKVRCSIGTKD
jgi:hypothetical protein